MLYDTTSLIFLSTLSLRRATIMFTGILAHDSNFYPRSPCGERPPSMIRQPTPTGFLSTLSLRRATISHFIPSNGTLHFYPRSPCGERPLGAGSARGMRSNFYPRSPCGERLGGSGAGSWRLVIFLSTLSLRRATTRPMPAVTRVANFYPRSPCGERPANWFDLWGWAEYFYPRSPCGERL